MNVHRLEDMDEARKRITAWLRWYRKTLWQNYPARHMARALDITAPALSNLLSGKRTAGIEVFIKLHRLGGLSADRMLNTDPPAIKNGEKVSGRKP